MPDISTPVPYITETNMLYKSSYNCSGKEKHKGNKCV